MFTAPESLNTVTTQSEQLAATAMHRQGKSDFPSSMFCDLAEAKAFSLG